MEDDDGAQHYLSPKQQEAKSAGAQPFRLRVTLRSTTRAQDSTDDGEEEEKTQKRGVKRARKSTRAKKKRHVKFEDEETAVALLSPSEACGLVSAEDVSDSFLAKREQNIRANKAMVNQKHSYIDTSAL